MYQLGLESNQLKNWSCTIKGVKITNAQVQAIKINWSIDNFNVYGLIIFKDLSDLISSAKVRGGDDIIFNLVDFDDTSWNGEFKVIDISQSRNQSGFLEAQIKFIDKISFEALKMYKPMSWLETNIINIINHKNTLKPLLTDRKKDFFKPINIYKNFVMNLNVSFNSIMKWLANKDDVKFFQNREAFIIQPLKELNSRGEKGEKFIYKTPNNAYRRKIYQYNAIFGKGYESLLVSPKTKTIVFDVESGKIVEVSKDPKGQTNILGGDGSIVTPIDLTDEKHSYIPHHQLDTTASERINRNTQKTLELEILVPGQFNTNIGDIVYLDLVDFKEKIKPEVNHSGKWLITSIVDNFIVPDFFQKITLTRPKYYE